MSEIKHGAARKGNIKRLYRIWYQMRQRCNNPNDAAYERYGGRGISICQEWQNDYVLFETWATQNGYADNLSIDRIDTDGNYCPENCRWANAIEQNNNKANVKKYEYNGETHSIAEWSRIVNICKEVIQYRLSLGWSFEKAITEPTHKHIKHKYVGVFYDKSHIKHPWRAYINVNGSRIRLGDFNTLKEAVIARRQAEIEYLNAQYTEDELLGLDVIEENYEK